MKSIYHEKKRKIYSIYGIGSTRFAIALANYYCSYLKKKTALVEAGEGNIADISCSKDLNCKIESFVKDELVGFTKMKVDYYPGLSYEEILKLINGNYEVLIIDVKELSHDYMNLFRLSDKSMYLCNIADYNRRRFSEDLRTFVYDMVEVEPYSYLLNSRDKTWFEKAYKKSDYYSGIREMLFIKDPDKLTKIDITFLKEIGC